MANNGCATAKSTTVTGQLSSPMADRPASVGDLSYYNLRIDHVKTELEFYGDGHEMSTTMSLRAIRWKDQQNGSESVGKLEELIDDMEIVNTIKESKHPGVIEQWERMQTLLALTEKDK